jgi:hypothetical protein
MYQFQPKYQTPAQVETHSQNQIISETNDYFQKVYSWMFLGLTLSGITAYWVAFSPSINSVILGNQIIFDGLLVGELLLVMGLVWMMDRINANQAVFLFLFYCFLTGLTMSVIFLVFTISSIGLTFFIAAIMFGAMSIYGYSTKTDLTGMGRIMIMGLIGLIFSGLINLFMQNDQVDYISSIIGVIVFTGLTAYDTQKIKIFNTIGDKGTPQDTKESIMGALILYLDFVNLFLQMLRLTGKRK